MAFVKSKGIAGQLFIFNDDNKPKKHNCPDCHDCQWCSDERCAMCLKRQKCKGRGCKRKAAVK